MTKYYYVYWKNSNKIFFESKNFDTIKDVINRTKYKNDLVIKVVEKGDK